MGPKAAVEVSLKFRLRARHVVLRHSVFRGSGKACRFCHSVFEEKARHVVFVIRSFEGVARHVVYVIRSLRK
jgi:hypothetical protein